MRLGIPGRLSYRAPFNPCSASSLDCQIGNASTNLNVLDSKLKRGENIEGGEGALTNGFVKSIPSEIHKRIDGNRMGFD
jgi:hypothetical protein